MLFSPQLYFSDPFLPHWEPQMCYTRPREKTLFEVIISTAKTWHHPGDKKNQKYCLAKYPLYPYWSCRWANFTRSQKATRILSGNKQMLFTESFPELYKTTSYVFSCHCSSLFSLVIFCEFLQSANLSATIHSF